MAEEGKPRAVRVVLVLLAAGAGHRLGGAAKALLPIGGSVGAAAETYLSRIARTARAAGVAEGVVVVAPPYGREVAEEARRLRLAVVENEAPERGMASSVELGFAWAMQERAATAALLWPCDHPAVQAETVRALLDAARDADAATAAATDTTDADANTADATAAAADTDAVATAADATAADADAIVPSVNGRGGHPALISRRLFPALTRCASAPQGARSVLRAAKVRRLAVSDPGCVIDVDEPAAARAVAEGA